jgi:hypothetical protein
MVMGMLSVKFSAKLALGKTRSLGATMRRQWLASSGMVMIAAIAFSLLSAFTLPHTTAQAKVICQQINQGKTTRTFSCPDGHTCLNVAGAWKCKPLAARPEPMACSVCYSNQKRDSDSCTKSGDLMAQSACVNRVNGALMKCLTGCK